MATFSGLEISSPEITYGRRFSVSPKKCPKGHGACDRIRVRLVVNEYEKSFRVAVNLSYMPYGDIRSRKLFLKRYLAIGNFLESDVSRYIAIFPLLTVSGNNYRARGVTGSK